jgi:hypothetical protein
MKSEIDPMLNFDRQVNLDFHSGTISFVKILTGGLNRRAKPRQKKYLENKEGLKMRPHFQINQ